MNAPTKNVLQVLEGATDYLARRAIESARLNAEHLLAHVLGKRRLDLYLEFDRPLSESDLAPMREKLKRRGEREPLQHILGTAEFCGRVFKCDPRALIPRPETEQLVEFILARIPANSAPRILDIGTGTGAIALTLAAELPAAKVEAADLSPDALALAAENAAALGLTDRARFFSSDLLAAADGSYDIIVANLPYIPAADLPTLAPEVQYDPATALDGGKDGLDFIDRLIETAPGHLRPGGLLALEIGHDQAERVLDKLRAAGYQELSAEADYQGINRFVFATYG